MAKVTKAKVKEAWAKTPRKATWTIYAAAIILFANVIGAFERVTPIMPVLMFQLEAQAAEIKRAQISITSSILDVKIQNYNQDLRWFQDRQFMLSLRLDTETNLSSINLIKQRMNDLDIEIGKIESRRTATHCERAKMTDSAWPGC